VQTPETNIWSKLKALPKSGKWHFGLPKLLLKITLYMAGRADAAIVNDVLNKVALSRGNIATLSARVSATSTKASNVESFTLA
jgi:hypothetical protein